MVQIKNSTSTISIGDISLHSQSSLVLINFQLHSETVLQIKAVLSPGEDGSKELAPLLKIFIPLHFAQMGYSTG